MALPLPRYRFTVEEYERLGEAGILAEDARVELLDGEIVEMTPIGPFHAGHVNRLNRLLTRALGDRALISVQNPLRLVPRSEPEPDLLLLRPRADDYATAHPTPADVLLLIEVADSSRVVDRSVKLPLYAAAEVPAVWLVDLIDGVIDCYEEPAAGAYRVERRAGSGAMATAATLPGLALPVDAILIRPA
jgi:Uma2 family endonuclease